jgi:hypothetical protein
MMCGWSIFLSIGMRCSKALMVRTGTFQYSIHDNSIAVSVSNALKLQHHNVCVCMCVCVCVCMGVRMHQPINEPHYSGATGQLACCRSSNTYTCLEPFPTSLHSKSVLCTAPTNHNGCQYHPPCSNRCIDTSHLRISSRWVEDVLWILRHVCRSSSESD